MLKDEILDEVQKGNFHLYSISRIEEAIELLTGIKAGKKLDNGSYQANTVFGLVEKKLKTLHQRSKPQKKNNNNKVQKKTKKKK